MLNRNVLILALGLWSMAATAQVPVVEAGGRNQRAAETEGNELLLTLYTQLEALQSEVQTLRGMVEEQSNQIRRLQTEQRDRYIDVDRRLSELSGGATTTLTPGVKFVVIRYGNFFQTVFPVPDGHVSVGLEPTANPPDFVFRIREMLDTEG